MSACQCCSRNEPTLPRTNLFNRVTVLLLMGWVGIVALAMELAGPKNLTAVPTLDAFLRSLL